MMQEQAQIPYRHRSEKKRYENGMWKTRHKNIFEEDKSKGEKAIVIQIKYYYST